MRFVSILCTVLLCGLISACGGGGGSAGTNGNTVAIGSEENSAGAISIFLKNSTGTSVSTVNGLDQYYLEAQVKNGDGLLAEGVVVTFTADSSLIKFSPTSGTALTDSTGLARIQISPASTNSDGAGNITAQASINSTDLSPAIKGVAVRPLSAVGNPILTLQMTNNASVITDSISGSDKNYLKATLKNYAGVPLSGQIVTFANVSATDLVAFGPATSALTDINGVATVFIGRKLTTSTGANTIKATATVANNTVMSPELNVSISALTNGGYSTMTLGLRDATNAATSIISRIAATTAHIQLLDPYGLPLKNTTVIVSGDARYVSFPAGSSALTDVNGIATVALSPGSSNLSGSATLTATAIYGLETVIQSIGFQVPVGTSAGVPTLTLGMSDGGNSVSAAGTSLAKAVLKDSNGLAIAGKLVTFSGESSLIRFSPASGMVLTDAFGVATIQISPASITASGAGTFAAAATHTDIKMQGSFDFQMAAANLSIRNLNLGAGAIPAFGNRSISAQAYIGDVSASNTPVQITFNASCGSILPPVVTTDATGLAATTYSASLSECSGKAITITALTSGATPASGTVSISPAVATNVSFVSTTPQLIYLQDSVGTTQAQVKFKVVDSSGSPLQNQTLRMSLNNSSTGVSLNTVGNTSNVDLTTDATGVASVAVFSGTVPTSLTVRATLLNSSNQPTSVYSDSNKLTVASGRPVQRSLSLNVQKWSLEAPANLDGQATQITLSMTDRQGNPVPPGTQVNFVSESGVVLPAVCFVPPVIAETSTSPAIPTSSCTVTFQASGYRPPDGKVSILAYVAGEENFVDANGNNKYDLGESYSDLGRAFRDDNDSGTYDSGEFQVPRLGAIQCSSNGGCPGDGVWGDADVRAQATIIFSTSSAEIEGAFSAPIGGVRSSLTGFVRDSNNVSRNSMPTGTTISISTVDNTTWSDACTLSSDSSFTVRNSLTPYPYSVGFNNCKAGDLIRVAVSSPMGLRTVSDFPVPLTDALSVSSGDVTTINVSDAASVFSIYGGVGPYQVYSADSTKVLPSISSDKLNLIGKSSGGTTVTVKDSSVPMKSFSISVSVN